ncbi:MAG TPA: DUF5134 domain-containing protein [Candidatus Dormibacteraeota bacterium]|nr:DUF5134 domain-containing protein [Candidatus Dormibacteraeota bacterium]
MKAECMPGMVMPGCASSVSPSHSQSGPPVIELALILVIILSSYVLFIFIWRYLQRGHIASYHTLPDLLGHTVHALGMIGMALLMIGTIAYIGPLSAYVVAFALFATVFLGGLLLRWNTCDRRSESWHLFINASMAYMFSATNVSAVTIICLAVYLAFIGSTLRAARHPLTTSVGSRLDRPSLRILGTNGDLTIAFSMMLMLIVTQWPQLFT